MARAEAALAPPAPRPTAALLTVALARAWRPVADGGLGVWLLILVAILGMAVAGAALAPYEPTAQDPISRLLGPLSTSRRGFHLLGTDALGRDLLSLVVVATRLTLVIAVFSTVVGGAIGTAVGLLAGYYGGVADRVIMRLTEAQTAMPMFLVAIFFLSVLGATVANVLLILPTLVWPAFARLVRAETLRVRETAFIEAAIATGCRDRTILWLHVLPNIAPRVLVLAVIEIGHVMLAEAGLSFLGVGVQPPDSTWGLLIGRGRQYLAVAWWLAIMPGVLLGLTVLSLNMLSRRFQSASGSAA